MDVVIPQRDLILIVLMGRGLAHIAPVIHSDPVVPLQMLEITKPSEDLQVTRIKEGVFQVHLNTIVVLSKRRIVVLIVVAMLETQPHCSKTGVVVVRQQKIVQEELVLMVM